MVGDEGEEAEVEAVIGVDEAVAGGCAGVVAALTVEVVVDAVGRLSLSFPPTTAL